MPRKNNPPKTSAENPKAFKLWIGKESLKTLSTEIKEVESSFNQKSFLALAPKLDPLELKARVMFISQELRKRLPLDEAKAITSLVAAVERGRLQGFVLWPITQFIQDYGLGHPKLSLESLRKITPHFTGEFAVRPFLIQNPEATLRFLMSCAKSENVHERRWASEGSRPRLPWGQRLDVFIKSPASTLPILEELKYDNELYVRKSVANHLNDISKDHPELLINTLSTWISEVPEEHRTKIEWITRHALRTLIKQGYTKALHLIGVKTKTHVKVSPLQLKKTKFQVGDHLEFSFTLKAQSEKIELLVVDYAIHFVKANGTTSKKVFKLKNLALQPGERKEISKRHHLKKITTRTYYSGKHMLEIQVNGISQGNVSWNLRT